MKKIFLLFAFLISTSFIYSDPILQTIYEVPDNSRLLVSVHEISGQELLNAGYNYHLSVCSLNDRDQYNEMCIAYYYYKNKESALKQYKQELRKYNKQLISFENYLDLLDNSEDYITEIMEHNNIVVYIYKKFCE